MKKKKKYNEKEHEEFTRIAMALIKKNILLNHSVELLQARCMQCI